MKQRPSNPDVPAIPGESPLRQLRAQRGLSARELAARANVATSTISRIERGDRGIGARSRRRIAMALGCSERDLFAMAERTGTPFDALLNALSKLIESGAHDIAAVTAEQLSARLREACSPFAIADDTHARVPAGRHSIEDLKVFCGRIEQHEVLTDDTADARHAQLIETWRRCDGELTPGFLDQMEALGLSRLVSIYDSAIKVRHIGDGTVFWTEEQRRAVIGRELFELAAPPEYTRLTHEALVDATHTGTVTHRLVTFDSGVHRVTYKRAAFWFPRSGLIVGSPALQATG
jgi:transcriptional regulator with XRE-family HTH domain